MAKRQWAGRSSLTHHEWRDPVYIQLFSPFLYLDPSLKPADEICIRKHFKTQVTTLPRQYKTYTKKHNIEIQLLIEEEKLRSEFVEEKTKPTSLSWYFGP